MALLDQVGKTFHGSPTNCTGSMFFRQRKYQRWKSSEQSKLHCLNSLRFPDTVTCHPTKSLLLPTDLTGPPSRPYYLLQTSLSPLDLTATSRAFHLQTSLHLLPLLPLSSPTKLHGLSAWIPSHQPDYIVAAATAYAISLSSHSGVMGIASKLPVLPVPTT